MNPFKRLLQKCLNPILHTAFVIKSNNVSFADKVKILGAIIYTIIPTDLIPDFIPLAGYCDDLATLIWAIHTIRKNTTPDIKAKTQEKLTQWLGE